MKFFLLLPVIIPQIAICQFDPVKYEDPYKNDIDKHIFRLMGTASLVSSLAFAGCYEHEIKKPFTVVVKAGPSFWADEYSSENGIELTAIASGELRYYFNLRRRVKYEKITRNFSASYLSLEPFVKSKSLTVLDQSGTDEKPSSAGVYINIGFQKQVKRSYINAFFGTRFFGKIYSNSVDVFDIIQGGIAFGRVIFY
ncbi:MAG: hypothetical protein ACXWWC_16425 [Chitinophagaceae bacterium]